MDKPAKIIIEQVANGFIFAPMPPSDLYGTDPSEKEVFQTMAALTERLENHFSHRCGHVSLDRVTSQTADA